MLHARSSAVLFIVTGLVIGLLFVVDLLVPGGPAPAVGYCAAVVLAGESGRPRITLSIAVICGLLTWLGAGLEPPSSSRWMAILNSGMVTAVIGLSAALALLRQRAIRHLEKRTDELARSNEELEHFAAVAAHDLRSPLTSISGCAKLLAERSNGGPANHCDDSRELLNFIQESARRMGTLIERMLHYARVGARSMEIKHCDANRVLEQTLGDLRETIKSRAAVVTHDRLPTLRADEQLLGRVFQNLLENAIKYHGEDAPKIHVSACRGSGEWVISVRDNGMGIAPRDAGKVFGLFDRGGRNDSDHPGSGIGLATCRKIIDRHGGRMWLDSKVGEGSTFHFSLPDD